MKKPQFKNIKKYFCKAKTVKCVINGIVIDVSNNKEYEYNKFDNSYTSVGGAVVFWNDGVYAEIVSENTECNCKK